MILLARQYRAIGLAALAVILAGIGFTCARGDAGKTQGNVISAGTEAFSVLEDEVMALTFSTARYTVTARRTRPAAPFAVHITFTDGRRAQHCQASPALAGQLAKFSTIIATRQISTQQLNTDFPTPLGVIAVEDRIVREAPAPLAFRASRDGSAVALTYQGHAVEVSVPLAAFAKFDGGCKALAPADEGTRTTP